jgi:hypothetical protein
MDQNALNNINPFSHPPPLSLSIPNGSRAWPRQGTTMELLGSNAVAEEALGSNHGAVAAHGLAFGSAVVTRSLQAATMAGGKGHRVHPMMPIFIPAPHVHRRRPASCASATATLPPTLRPSAAAALLPASCPSTIAAPALPPGPARMSGAAELPRPCAHPATPCPSLISRTSSFVAWPRARSPPPHSRSALRCCVCLAVVSSRPASGASSSVA